MQSELPETGLASQSGEARAIQSWSADRRWPTAMALSASVLCSLMSAPLAAAEPLISGETLLSRGEEPVVQVLIGRHVRGTHGTDALLPELSKIKSLSALEKLRLVARTIPCFGDRLEADVVRGHTVIYDDQDVAVRTEVVTEDVGRMEICQIPENDRSNLLRVRSSDRWTSYELQWLDGRTIDWDDTSTVRLDLQEIELLPPNPGFGSYIQEADSQPYFIPEPPGSGDIYEYGLLDYGSLFKDKLALSIECPNKSVSCMQIRFIPDSYVTVHEAAFLGGYDHFNYINVIVDSFIITRSMEDLTEVELSERVEEFTGTVQTRAGEKISFQGAPGMKIPFTKNNCFRYAEGLVLQPDKIAACESLIHPETGEDPIPPHVDVALGGYKESPGDLHPFFYNEPFVDDEWWDPTAGTLVLEGHDLLPRMGRYSSFSMLRTWLFREGSTS